MADDYTPDTQDVRMQYRGGWSSRSIVGRNADGEFDRWLAEHDAEVAEKARADALTEVKAERDTYLSSLRLSRDWIAGWHASNQHIQHVLARLQHNDPNGDTP